MDDKLLLWLASVRGDPLAFTMGAYPWGEPGTVLENSTGRRFRPASPRSLLGSDMTPRECVILAQIDMAVATVVAIALIALLRI